MAANFLTLGPFEVTQLGQPLETKELKALWARIDGERKGLSAATGVYVFAIGSPKNLTAIYVGRAEHGFRSRLRPNHDAFRKAQLNHGGEGLFLLLIPRVTKARNEFVRKREKDEKLKSIRDLEILLLRDFMRSGARLLNSSEKIFFEKLVVPGYLHDQGEELNQGSIALKKMLRVTKKRS